MYGLGNGGDGGDTDRGISLREATITDLDFADDVVIFEETLEALVGALDTLSREIRASQSEGPLNQD